MVGKWADVRPKLAAATIWNQLENQFQLEEATHQQRHLRGWINNRVERERNRYNCWVGNIGDEMKKSWKRSKNAMTIFWRRGTEGKATHCKQKTEKEKRKRSVCKERRKDTKRDEHLSALGGTNLHRHSHPLQGSLSFLYIFHQVVMVLFQAVTIIFSLMAITLVVLLSTLGKCQQQTQLQERTNAIAMLLLLPVVEVSVATCLP